MGKPDKVSFNLMFAEPSLLSHLPDVEHMPGSEWQRINHQICLASLKNEFEGWDFSSVYIFPEQPHDRASSLGDVLCKGKQVPRSAQMPSSGNISITSGCGPGHLCWAVRCFQCEVWEPAEISGIGYNCSLHANSTTIYGAFNMHLKYDTAGRLSPMVLRWGPLAKKPRANLPPSSVTFDHECASVSLSIKWGWSSLMA